MFPAPVLVENNLSADTKHQLNEYANVSKSAIFFQQFRVSTMVQATRANTLLKSFSTAPKILNVNSDTAPRAEKYRVVVEISGNLSTNGHGEGGAPCRHW